MSDDGGPSPSGATSCQSGVIPWGWTPPTCPGRKGHPRRRFIMHPRSAMRPEPRRSRMHGGPLNLTIHGVALPTWRNGSPGPDPWACVSVRGIRACEGLGRAARRSGIADPSGSPPLWSTRHEIARVLRRSRWVSLGHHPGAWLREGAHPTPSVRGLGGPKRQPYASPGSTHRVAASPTP